MKKIFLLTFLFLCVTMNCFGKIYKSSDGATVETLLVCENNQLFLVTVLFKVNSTISVSTIQVMQESRMATMDGPSPVRCK